MRYFKEGSSGSMCYSVLSSNLCTKLLLNFRNEISLPSPHDSVGLLCFPAPVRFDGFYLSVHIYFGGK